MKFGHRESSPTKLLESRRPGRQESWQSQQQGSNPGFARR